MQVRGPLYPALLAGVTLASVGVRWGLQALAPPHVTSSDGSPDAAVISPSAYFDAILVAATMLLLGIPHGALDSLVSKAVRKECWKGSPADSSGGDGSSFFALPSVGFVAWYLAQVFLYFAVWVLLPQVAMCSFLALTAYHFGETDLEALAQGDPAIQQPPHTPVAVVTASPSAPTSPAAHEARRRHSQGALRAALSTLHLLFYGSATLATLLLMDPAATLATLEALGVVQPFGQSPAGDGAWGSLTPAAPISGQLSSGAAPGLLLLPALPAAVAALLSHPAVVAWAQPQMTMLASAGLACAGGKPAGLADRVHRLSRWRGFVLLLLSLCVAGCSAGAAVPFAMYYGGWHSAQSLAHVGDVVVAGTGDPANSPRARLSDAQVEEEPGRGVAEGGSKRSTWLPEGPWLAHQVWLSVAALLLLVPLAFLLPTAYGVPLVRSTVVQPGGAAAPSSSPVGDRWWASGVFSEAQTRGAPPVPPLVLVLLAGLTLPHSQIMHASYAALRHQLAAGRGA